MAKKLTAESAQNIYDQIDAKLQEPQFNPRQLYEQFNIEWHGPQGNVTHEDDVTGGYITGVIGITEEDFGFPRLQRQQGDIGTFQSPGLRYRQ